MEKTVVSLLKEDYEDFSQVLNFCIQCGLCSPSCPSSNIMNFTLRQAVTAIGSRNVGRVLNDDSIKYILEQIRQGSWYCFDCGYCEEVCPVDMKVPELMTKMREESRVNGFLPDSAKMMNSNIKNHHNPYGKYAQRQRTDWSDEFDLPSESEVMLFFGCTPAYKEKNILTSTMKILKDQDVGILEDEWCCGYPTKVMGYTETAKKMARHNIEAIKDAGADRVITVCPTCYRTLEEEYPRMVGELPFEVMHVTEYLQELLQGNDTTFKELEKRVTYQDSCHLGRHMSVYESPRDVLRSVPSLELVEMSRNRWRARCCGGGGGVKSVKADLSREQGVKILEQAEKEAVEELITACPFCKWNLTDSAKKADTDINIEYITEFLLQAMPEDGGISNEK